MRHFSIGANAVVDYFASRISRLLSRMDSSTTVNGRAAVTLAAAICCASTNAQTLDEALRLTLRTNPDILATRHSLEAQRDLRRQAKAGYFPSIDLVLAGGREDSDNTTTRAANVDSLKLTRSENSLRLTQMLYDGFATKNLVAQQSALVEAALSRLVGSRETISLRAIQVYLEVLRRQLIVDLSQANLDQHEETLTKIQERFESGVGTKVDVVQTEGRRAQSKSNLLLSEREVRNGNAQYYRVVGEYPSDLLRPDPAPEVPTTLDMALELAFGNSPKINAAEAELQAAVAANKQARAGFRPRFDLELGATRNEDTDGTVGDNDDETAIVRVSYNLYRGGADRARANEAEAREFAAREGLRSIKLGVEEDVTVIWNELEDVLMRLEYLQAHVTSTEEVLVVYNEQLSLGKRTLLDLLDVQNELLRARVALATGEFTALFARYRLLAAIGQLLRSLGLEDAP